MCPSRRRAWTVGWDSECDKARGRKERLSSSLRCRVLPEMLSVIKPWGKLPGHFKKKTLSCFFWHPEWVSLLMRLYTELRGQPLCFNVMSEELFHLRSRRVSPRFLLFFHVGFWEHVSSLDFKAEGIEASLGSLVARVRRGPRLKLTTYEEEFHKPYKYRLPKRPMTM